MKLSRAAITKRVNALIAKGVIHRFTISVNPKTLNLDLHVLFEIATKPAMVEIIMDELEIQPEVGRIMLTGATSFFVSAYFEDSNHLNRFLIQKLSKLKGVLEIKTNVILDERDGKSISEARK